MNSKFGKIESNIGHFVILNVMLDMKNGNVGRSGCRKILTVNVWKFRNGRGNIIMTYLLVAQKDLVLNTKETQHGGISTNPLRS